MCAVEVGEDGGHAAVAVLAVGDVELFEDVAHWASTVRSLTTSRLAMAELVSPWAISFALPRHENRSACLIAARRLNVLASFGRSHGETRRQAPRSEAKPRQRDRQTARELCRQVDAAVTTSPTSPTSRFWACPVTDERRER
jgi:hypothetical protein